MTLEPLEYQKIIDGQQEQIEELCMLLQSVRGSKISEHAGLIARLIKERNTLQIQRFEALETVRILNLKLDKCERITKHFVFS